MSARADVGAVAIGRNEGERLARCLASLGPVAARTVYVDSGSTDDSVALARRAGAEVVALDVARPFTAARARNAGLAVLRARAPELRYVQFVDGDCALDPGWIDAAAAFLDARPRAAVACGRRREIAPEATLYNRLCDMEWDTPAGEAEACGGDALMRIAALDAAGGYDPDFIAGEEPELCFRLRRAGWSVHRLDREMTRHDAAIARFGQWWRRTLRSGWAYAAGFDAHGRGPERFCAAPLRSIAIWGAAVPAVAAAALAAALAGWAAAGWAAAGLAALYPLQAARVARGRRRARGDAPAHALAYGVFVMLGKPAQALGALRYLRDRLGGGPRRLIEYKGAAPAG